MSDSKQTTVLPTLAQEVEQAQEKLVKANVDALQKVVDTKTGRHRGRVSFSIMDTNEDGKILNKTEDEPLAGTLLAKSVLNATNEVKRGKTIQRLAFEEDPTQVNYYQSLWVPKIIGVPDSVLKQIAYRDSLVATILNTRGNQISAFGRELQDRFATGFRIEPKPGIMEDSSDENKERLQARIDEVSKKLSNCGSLDGVAFDERMTLSTFLGIQTRNGLLFGRFATEIIYTRDPNGDRKFHSFRPSDVGTIYRAAPRHGPADAVRKQALALLQTLKGPDAEKLRPEKFENDEYAWIQVVNGRPRQAFTPEEMIISNLYPCTDIDLRGYPLTPLDTVVDAVATHLNITQHNKIYFQSGRAARGMIVIKSPDVDQGLVSQIRQHFNASINSVTNAWRVPVFGVDPEDDITWSALEGGGAGRDAEFQYLTDQNAREILSAFQISPDELPGYQHLSRGTNSQALSESSNEFKLEAARDVGIRPLLNHFQDFLNDVVLPLLDPAVAKLCTLKLYGLDADTEEKEDTGIMNRQGIDLSMDEILERKEKDPIGKEWGGKWIFNPSWQAILDNHSGLMVGEIAAHFLGRPDLAKRQDLQYVRDPFWFQFQQLQMQAQQMQAQAQQGAQGQPGEGGEEEGGGDEGSDKDQGEQPEPELASGADQVLQMLGKSEKNLSPNKRKLLTLHAKIVKEQMDEWQRDSEEALAEILKTVKQHKE